LRRGWIAPFVVTLKYFSFQISLRGVGWEPPLEPVKLRPLPVAMSYGQGRVMKQEASPFRAGRKSEFYLPRSIYLLASNNILKIEHKA